MKKLIGFFLLTLVFTFLNSCKSNSTSNEQIDQTVKGFFTSIKLDNQVVQLKDSLFIYINPAQTYFEIEKGNISCKVNYVTTEQIGVKDNVKYNATFKDDNNCSNQTGGDLLLQNAFKALTGANAFKKIGNELHITGDGIEMLVDIFVISKPIELPEDILDVDAKSVSISRTACLGHCPSYDLSIYENGVMDWNGKKFVTALGMELYKEDTSYCNRLFEYLDQMNFEETNTINSKELTDESIITIEYEGKKAVFREKGEIDPAYKNLFKMLEAFLDRKELVTKY